MSIGSIGCMSIGSMPVGCMSSATLAGGIFTRGNVNTRVAIEKVDRLEVKANHFNRHDWEILQTGDMLLL